MCIRDRSSPRLGSKNAESRAHPRDDEDAEDNLVDADLALDEGVDDGCGYYGQHADHDLVEDARLDVERNFTHGERETTRDLDDGGDERTDDHHAKCRRRLGENGHLLGKGREELVAELIAYAPVKELPYEDGDGDGKPEKHADGVSRL